MFNYPEFDDMNHANDPEFYRAAAVGAEFLRALPARVDPYNMLKVMGGYLGDEMATEIFRFLMDPNRSVGFDHYHCREFPQTRQNSPQATTGQSYKINAIKEVRQVTGWGLKEAKDFVEGTVMQLSPSMVSELIKTLNMFGYAIYPSR